MTHWRRTRIGLGLLVLLGTLGCEQASENAGSVSGPGIDLDCLKRQRQALLPGQGAVGDTEATLNCAPE